MRKIFLYECKRLLWNKFFAGLVLVLLFYGWQVLRRVTILGVSHTAPFSPWSFGDFLSRMLPLLWIGALFFLTFFTSEKARRAAVLTDAAPLPPRRYALARCAAALAGAGLMSQLGYPELAPLIAQHNDLEEPSRTDEAAVVFLADKLRRGAAPVRVTERFRESISRCRDEEARRAHGRRLEAALESARRINDICGKDVVQI